MLISVIIIIIFIHYFSIINVIYIRMQSTYKYIASSLTHACLQLNSMLKYLLFQAKISYTKMDCSTGLQRCQRYLVGVSCIESLVANECKIIPNLQKLENHQYVRFLIISVRRHYLVISEMMDNYIHYSN